MNRGVSLFGAYTFDGQNEKEHRRDGGGRTIRNATGLGIIDALTYLAGVWLILTPFVLNSPFSEGSADGDWNAILVGSALVALGALSLVDPPIGPTANLMRLPLGGWLAVSPLLLGAESGAHPAAWAVANVVTGPLVLVLWGAGLALVHRAEAGRPSGSRAA